MKKSMCGVLGLVVLFGALFAPGWSKETSAELRVNIDIAIPPPLQFAEPPDVYVVPSGSSYVYMAPDYDGVYFYGGNWYRLYNDRWFRSSRYNGDWGYIETSIVPQVIIVLPPEYIHYVPSGYNRIHYDDFHSNWQSWDQGRHWDSYDWYKHERRDDIRRERYNFIERDRHQRGVQTSQHQQWQGHQQRNVQRPQQRNVQKPQQHDVQRPQQHNVQKPQQRNVQKPQQRNVQKPQQRNVQKPQQRNVQKPQQQQGEKKHEEDR